MADEKKIKPGERIEKEFMENNTCPKCGAKKWKARHRVGNIVYDMKCENCGFLLYDISPIKNACKTLGLTYAELAAKIGYGAEAVSKAARTYNISPAMDKALALYLENLELKNKLKTLDNLAVIIKELSK